jgi:CheY-like chemotaxis protein
MTHDAAALLVVEDDPDALLLLKRALIKTGLGASVHVALDGEEALAYLEGRGIFADRRTHPLPCLILLNLKLPRKSGLEVLEWIRRQPCLRRIPVVIVTTSDEEQDRRRALELGAREYIIKPIETSGLLWLARKVVKYIRIYGERIRSLVEQDREGVPPLPF